MPDEMDATNGPCIIVNGTLKLNSPCDPAHRTCTGHEEVEEVTIYKLPGERLGMAVNFDDNPNNPNLVARCFVQNISHEGPSAIAERPLKMGDEILQIEGKPVSEMSKSECIDRLRNATVRINLLVRTPQEAEALPSRRKKGPPPPLPPPKPFAKDGVKEKVIKIDHSIQRPSRPPPLPPKKPQEIQETIEPAFFMDLIAEEDEHTIIESESDDTGSSVSTVIERTSTANSSFSEHCRPLKIDLQKVLSPFEQLEKELDSHELFLKTAHDRLTFHQEVSSQNFIDEPDLLLLQNTNSEDEASNELFSIDPPESFQDREAMEPIPPIGDNPIKETSKEPAIISEEKKKCNGVKSQNTESSPPPVPARSISRRTKSDPPSSRTPESKTSKIPRPISATKSLNTATKDDSKKQKNSIKKTPKVKKPMKKDHEVTKTTPKSKDCESKILKFAPIRKSSDTLNQSRSPKRSPNLLKKENGDKKPPMEPEANNGHKRGRSNSEGSSSGSNEPQKVVCDPVIEIQTNVTIINSTEMLQSLPDEVDSSSTNECHQNMISIQVEGTEENEDKEVCLPLNDLSERKIDLAEIEATPNLSPIPQNTIKSEELPKEEEEEERSPYDDDTNSQNEEKVLNISISDKEPSLSPPLSPLSKKEIEDFKVIEKRFQELIQEHHNQTEPKEIDDIDIEEAELEFDIAPLKDTLITQDEQREAIIYNKEIIKEEEKEEGHKIPDNVDEEERGVERYIANRDAYLDDEELLLESCVDDLEEIAEYLGLYSGGSSIPQESLGDPEKSAPHAEPTLTDGAMEEAKRKNEEGCDNIREEWGPVVGIFPDDKQSAPPNDTLNIPEMSAPEEEESVALMVDLDLKNCSIWAKRLGHQDGTTFLEQISEDVQEEDVESEDVPEICSMEEEEPSEELSNEQGNDDTIPEHLPSKDESASPDLGDDITELNSLSDNPAPEQGLVADLQQVEAEVTSSAEVTPPKHEPSEEGASIHSESPETAMDLSEEGYGPRLPPDGHELPLSYFDQSPCPPILASKISSSSSSCEDSGVFFEDTEPKILAEKCKTASRYPNLRGKEYPEENGNPSFDSADELESISSLNSHSAYASSSVMDKSKRAPVTEDMALMLSQDTCWGKSQAIEEPRHSRFDLPHAPPRDRSIYSSSGYSKNSSNLTFKEKLALFTKAEQEGQKNNTSFGPHHPMKHAISSDNLCKSNADFRPACPQPSFYESKWVSTTNVYSTSLIHSESKIIVNSSTDPVERSNFEKPNADVPPIVPRKHSVESIYPQSQLMGFKRYSLSSLGTVKPGEDIFKKSSSSIFESKTSSVSKFKGLVIPNKISPNNVLGKSLPTLVGPDPSTVAKSQPIKLQPMYQTSSLTYPQDALPQENGVKMHPVLSEPPWKGGTHSLPKYSPAFKRRTLELPKARSPTPPLSPQSPTPSSPSSACSSNASSTTKPNMFQFSLSHSKPVIPLLPEKPNMSPPSISSETETASSSSPELTSPIIPSKKSEVPQPPPLPAKRPPPPLPAKPSARLAEKPQAPPRTVSLPNGVANEAEIKPINGATPVSEELGVNRNEMVDKVAEIIELSIDNLPKRAPPSVDQNSTAIARLDLLIGAPPNQEIEKSVEEKSVPVVPENNLTTALDSNEELKNQHNLQLHNHFESSNKSPSIIDNNESTKLIKELSLEKQDYWSDINKRAPSSKHDSDDDAYSSVSQKTDDSRNTLDDSCSDLTCDSCELKPKRLSQQKTVLKTYIENTDSAKNFKALAERWEQRSGDSGTETPVQPPSPPAVPPPTKKESYKHTYKDITARIPHMLMPRVVEENSVDSSRNPTRDTYSSSRRSVDHYVETRNFRQSLEYLGPPRAKVISSSKSVSDICRAFESQAQNTPVAVVVKTPQWQPHQHQNLVRHQRISSVDSTASESSSTPAHYGSMGSLASSCSLQEDEAEVTVILRRDGGGSAGIALAGGADCEVKDITVHRVIVGSPADRDGRVRRGDRLLSINGRSLRGITHRHALELLKSPRQELVLVLARPSSLDTASTVESPVVGEKGPTQLVTLFKDGAGLGFIIEGGKDSPLGDRPITIKRIFKCGAADKSGQLCIGDELLELNGQPITTAMTRTEVWNLMKKAPDGEVNITVRKIAS